VDIVGIMGGCALRVSLFLAPQDGLGDLRSQLARTSRLRWFV
jgi:hypothetical protein